jgi:hypothetical protein
VLRNDILTERFGPMSEAAEAALDQLFPVVYNDAVSAEWLQQQRMRAYWRFYAKPRSILNLARRMTNRRAVQKLARAVGRRVLQRESSSVN